MDAAAGPDVGERLAGPDVPRDRAAGILGSIADERADQRTAKQRVHRPGMSAPPRGLPIAVFEQQQRRRVEQGTAQRRIDMTDKTLILEPDASPLPVIAKKIKRLDARKPLQGRRAPEHVAARRRARCRPASARRRAARPSRPGRRRTTRRCTRGDPDDLGDEPPAGRRERPASTARCSA
jgi:hypothetical protein